MSIEKIEQEASDWFARMRGPEAEHYRQAFDAWLAVPRHAEVYGRRLRAWDKMMFVANTGTGRGRDLARARPLTLGLPPWLVAASACFAFVVGAALLLGPLRSSNTAAGLERVEFAAVDEAPRRIALPDGSTVILDRGSKLELAFSASERRMRLIAGRGRFTVAHDRNHPFIVDAGGGSVIAHGTMFDVDFRDRAVKVALLQGAVEVRTRAGSSGARTNLAAGQRIEIAGGAISLSRPLGQAERAWPQDMLLLDGVDLGEAVSLFNRTSRVHVVIDPSVDRNMKVAGAFRRSDPDAFAYQLAETFGLVVEAREGGSLALAAPAAK